MAQYVKSLTDIPAVATYLRRIGAEPRSLTTAVVKLTMGRYWRDVGKITFENGKVRSTRSEDAPTESEQVHILEEWQRANFPKVQRLRELSRDNLPIGIDRVDDPNLFVFRDIKGYVIMLQYRRDDVEGGKSYYPWTYWEDGEWRMCEPDGPLPLWGLEQLKDYKTVFVHEGARAARTCAEMVRKHRANQEVSHPWIEMLAHSAHLGWISGALSPSRTDWKSLERLGVTMVHIVADNDWEGKSAVPAISQRLHCPTFMVEFTDAFPTSFDLHDPFPDHMWDNGQYNGPHFRDCLHPATWATREVEREEGEKGPPRYTLRDAFKSMWMYVEEPNLFVCRPMPEFVRDSEILNRMLAPFSHVKDTVSHILRAQRGRSVKLAYRPDINSANKLKVTYDGVNAINTFVPARIKAVHGDIGIFNEFMDYMIVQNDERKTVEKWVATLIARPEIRIGFGILMVSETQGVGKTTLGAHILAPLVGWNNVSVPSEEDLLSPFTEWVSHKRLVVCNEIYSGSSWKAYNRLKSLMTDERVSVNRKFLREYSIENWAHFYACSNSRRAIKVDDADRRWFYPELSERLWPKEKFDELYTFIKSGGLARIKHWAENYGDYWTHGDHAPMTSRKLELIEASMSDAKREAIRIGQLLADVDEQAAAIAMRDLKKWILNEITDRRIYDSDHQLRKGMVTVDGLYVWPDRLKIDGLMQYVVMNEAGYREVLDAGEYTNETIRGMKITPATLTEERWD